MGTLLAAFAIACAAAPVADLSRRARLQRFVPPDWKAIRLSRRRLSDRRRPAAAAALALEPPASLRHDAFERQCRIAILPLPPSRTVCAASQFLATPPPDFNSGFEVNAEDFAHLIGSDPGGWYTYEDYVWRISTAPCVGVHYYIGYHADDSDQAKSEKPFDRAKLLALLDSIRATIVLDPSR